jgi:hypothetical protein
MRINIPRDREREIPPAGSHDAVCYCCVDLGTQNTAYGSKRQLYLAWELPDETTAKGYPHLVGKFYNLTGNSRGTLYQDLESWFGKVLDPADIEGLDLIEELIGRTATLGLVHNTKENGQTRANVTSVMLPRRGIAPKTRPATAPITFGFDDGFDSEAYGQLPEWLRTIVARSPEYQRVVASEMANGPMPPPKRQPEMASAASNLGADIDDEIPF